MSVAAQSYPFIEHIVIDGASTDDTLDIVKEFPHISKLISEKDSGIYDAMNKGIALATGDIVGILNSDDFFADNGVVERIVHTFQSGCDAVYGDLVFVDRLNLNKVKRVWVAGDYRPMLLYRGWMPPHPTFYVRRHCYERFGNFNTRFKVAADYDLLIRLLLVNRIKVSYIPRVLIHMRTGGVSSTRSLRQRFSINREDQLVWKLNNQTPRWYTLYCKPLYKLKQFIVPVLKWPWKTREHVEKKIEKGINTNHHSPVTRFR